MASRLRLLSRALLVTLLAVGAAAGRSPKDPREALRPPDQRLAQSISLRRSDFAAGWKQERGQSSGSEQLRCPKLGYDPNFSDLVLTGRATSPNFARGNDEFLVSSDVEVYRSAREAKTSFRRSLAPSLNQCLENSLRQQATKNVKVGLIHVARLSFPRLGDRTAAFRVRALFSGRHREAAGLV